MNPIRRELINGLLVLVVASLLSVAFSAFQVSFNAVLWVLILMGVAMAIGGYVVLEFVLSNQEGVKKTEQRELEWLKRVGNPARLDYSLDRVVSTSSVVDALRSMKSGSALTMMTYVGSEGGGETPFMAEARRGLFSAVMDQVNRGTIREYKRLLCFDHDVFAQNLELKSGIVRVGEGPGTISREQGEHCRQMMEARVCSLYVAPVILKSIVAFFGTDTVSPYRSRRRISRPESDRLLGYCCSMIPPTARSSSSSDKSNAPPRGAWSRYTRSSFPRIRHQKRRRRWASTRPSPSAAGHT